MTSSLTISAILFVIYVLIPISLLKIGFNKSLRLAAHEFSFLTELSKFYWLYAVTLILICLVFYAIGVSPHDTFWSYALFPGSTKGRPLAILELANIETGTFMLSLYASCFCVGIIRGRLETKKLEQWARSSSPLILPPEMDIVSIWDLIFKYPSVDVRDKSSPQNVQLYIDILANGDILYTGTLSYYDARKSELVCVVLRNTKRATVPLNEIKGVESEMFTIPGDVMFFPGSQIKNLNIRSVEVDTGSEVLMFSPITLQPDDLEKFLNDFSK